MTEPHERPDPDALLQRITEEETRSAQGNLKIFFGFAPGVGKTYRMLKAARDLVSEKGLDVVVGVVETHSRGETAAMIGDLEVLPRRRVPYRGHTLDDFDLDAALARKPQLLLVDELAHTNAPGGRHAKRWQDVAAVLSAGIDVATTVNVQHIESLNDVVAQITGVRVKETIPDSILDRANEVELVDIAPEMLVERLREGKVYLADQARRAGENFFKRGNLLALRELALRRTAEHVDADVTAYRQEHGVAATWPTTERILVCVGPAPSSSRLLRSAARMAKGLRCPWVAAYVETTALGPLGEAAKERLEAHLRLAGSLEGSVARLVGTRISEALLQYSRKHNVTRIIIGKPTHSRLRDLVRGSLLDEIVRGSGDIDVQVISGDGAEPAPRDTKPEGERATWDHTPYAWASLMVAATTALAISIREVFPLPDLEVLYLLCVMLAAYRFGRGPSILSAALGVAAYDFFFVPPYYTFAVADGRYLLTFAMMFAVGFVVSELTTRLRRQEKDAVSREERTRDLYALSKAIGSVEARPALGAVVAEHARDLFHARAYVLHVDERGELVLLGSAPKVEELDPKDLGVARWSFEHGSTAGWGTSTLPGSGILCIPLRVGASTTGVLALDPEDKTPLALEQRDLLDAFSRQAALAFERIHLAEEARLAALRAKTEEMRSSLLSAVSHDLRTPLAAITGAATSLIHDRNLATETRAELLDAICSEAERLERLVSNLLDMTRLASGGVSLKKEWIPIEELIGSALTRLDARLVDRDVRIELAPDLPMILVDPVLFPQIFVNLFENAAKYTPIESPIEVRGRCEGDLVAIEVMDRGPGLPLDGTERIFEKFVRGEHVGVGGVGLGLSICRAIAEAHGGSMRAENREGGGASFRVLIPVPEAPPPVSDGGER